jgi:Transposase IS4
LAIQTGTRCSSQKYGTEWSSTPDTSKQKTPSKNFFKPPRTKINNVKAQSAVDPGSTFNLFLPASLIIDLVKYTNLEDDRIHGDTWKPTDVIEVRALIGAYILLGAMNQNIFPSELIWDVNNDNQSI